MKNTLKSHVLLQVMAMTSIINTITAQDTVFAVEPGKMMVLYAGVENPLTVACTVKYDSIAISTGSLIPKDRIGEYSAYVTGGNDATVSVFYKGKPVAEKSFRIKMIPVPKICVAGRTESSGMKKSELLALSTVGAVIPGFDFDLTFKVVGLEVTFYSEGKIKSFIMSGNQLSEECRAALVSADKGKDIWFDAKAMGPDGSVRSLAPLKIKLLE